MGRTMLKGCAVVWLGTFGLRLMGKKCGTLWTALRGAQYGLALQFKLKWHQGLEPGKWFPSSQSAG